MRGDETIWLLLGVILLLGVMASFSPQSTLGRAIINMQRALGNAFGTGATYCPFVNPYAVAILSSGEIVISGNHPLCPAVEKIMGGEGKSCSQEYVLKVNREENRIYVNDKGFDMGDFFERLRNIQQNSEDISPETKVALSLLSQKIPAWECLLIYGLLPFFLLYSLINDILAFAFMRTNTRRLIAVFASLLAVLTGAVANLVVAISEFVGISTSYGFFMLLFAMAIISVLLGQLTLTMGVAQTTVNAVQNALVGMLTLNAISRGATAGQRRE